MEAKYLEEKGEYIKTERLRVWRNSIICMNKSSETFWEVVDTQDGLSGSLLHD